MSQTGNKVSGEIVEKDYSKVPEIQLFGSSKVCHGYVASSSFDVVIDSSAHSFPSMRQRENPIPVPRFAAS